jgi:hypothetical protein
LLSSRATPAALMPVRRVTFPSATCTLLPRKSILQKAGEAALLDILDDRDQQRVNGLAIEVLLGLIDYDRLVALVDQKVENQQELRAIGG